MNDTARIFQELTGRYHVCDDDLPHLDARGPDYLTKAEAYRAAYAAGYDHAVGSGTYRGRRHAIPARYRVAP